MTSSSMSLEDVFLELTDDSGKAARKLKKAVKEQEKREEREAAETAEEVSGEIPAETETKQEEGDAQ